MKTSFLTGNFLRAYADAYGYPKDYGKPSEKADPDWLKDRFAYRAKRNEDRKRNYIIGLQAAAIFALLVAIGLTSLEIRTVSEANFAVAEQERVALQEIVQTLQETPPPTPPRPVVPIAVPDDELLVEDVLDLDASLDLTAAAAALPPPPAPVEEEDEVDEREIFVVVEQRPELIGGVAELAKAVEYPNIARQAGIEGMVVVKIVVNAEGIPMDPEVLRSPSDVLNRAAVDAVMKQRFTPGRQRGRAVAVEMAIPVRFQLTDA